MKIKLLLVVISLIVVSCNIDNTCGECTTPPRQFNFDFVDKDSDENLYVNNTFDRDSTSVVDENDADVAFQLVYYNERYIFSLSEIGWELDPKVYTIKLNNDVSVVFELDMDKIQGDCCTYYDIKEFTLQTYEYTESPTNGIIQVKL